MTALYVALIPPADIGYAKALEGDSTMWGISGSMVDGGDTPGVVGTPCCPGAATFDESVLPLLAAPGVSRHRRPAACTG